MFGFGKTMPLISETPNTTFKSRMGFQDNNNNTCESIRSIQSSPDLLLTTPLNFSSSAVRSGDSFELSEDPSFWKDHNVQVIIRVRPLSHSEISLQGNSRCVRQESCQTITWTGHPESRFTFDVVADENVNQEMLFKVAGVPMVENCMGGYNSCMFAYGQTGSGKTHTMLGDIESGTRRHSVNCGMTPRVFEYLFSRIQKEKEARREEKIKFISKCSFLEIYNEQIIDLLDPSSTNLQIREDSNKGVYVENVTEVEVTSARDVIQQLVQGATNRKVAATNMNCASSRSHSVFTCIIESKWESQGVTRHRFARLNLVDLAGSERQKSSGAEGERLKEATNINKSLSTLGLVIMNLVSISNGKSLHVPYRDSKLTFLLQDSLGGNAKTIIIANISPSISCSLETLSTLKFAQRAKFIKNHAIVNEDASGDVLAMRMQIQQLKKEVSRLQSVVNGGAENHEGGDAWTVSFPGSPGTFKWEGHGSFSPLTSNKRMSNKKEYEVALVGAFRREKDKEIALQASIAETKAAMQLAKQREDEIQGLKMRLRFREAGIKRLEAVASGKISAETHLLKEKEEHLKEIEVIRNQVDRNQEVTRFAMENLRLKEEIRRLKSFCEEGERERMNEHITLLQNKLLEALDWKLMHESDPSIVQNGSSELATYNPTDDLLISSQESASPWRTSINEENEFLRMQAIQNQSELDALRKKLNFCMDEKDKLERHVNELETELEAERSSKTAMKEENQKLHIEFPSLTTGTGYVPNITRNDQIELKTMVDAIATASQREAEAHETAILLSKENDELRMKLKVLLEDNNKLIELYEQAGAEDNNKISDRDQSSEENKTGDQYNHLSQFSGEECEIKKKVENLENQLMEMHEENEKLMSLYEKAMQERDEFKKLLTSSGQSVESKGEFNCPEKLVEIDGGEPLKSDNSPPGVFVQNERENVQLENLADYVDAKVSLEETGLFEVNVQNGYIHGFGKAQTNDYHLGLDERPTGVEAQHFRESGYSELNVQYTVENLEMGKLTIFNEEEEGFNQYLQNSRAKDENHIGGNELLATESKSSRFIGEKHPDDLNLVRLKLDKAQEKVSSLTQAIHSFGLLERAMSEVDKLSIEIEALEDGIQGKQQEYASSKLLSFELQDRRVIIDKKLTAIKHSLSCFSSSVGYFEQRETQAREKVNASSAYLKKKKQELTSLQTGKDKIEDSQRKIQQSEVELKENLANWISKIEEENRKQENERVLFAIDNVENRHYLSGKATELLKSAEDKTKLQTEMKQAQEKLRVLRMEVENLNTKHEKNEREIQVVQMEIQKGLKYLEERESKLHIVIQEKEMVLEMKENGKNEFENMILEYHQYTFESTLKEEEMKILEEDLQMELRRIEELHNVKAIATRKKAQLFEVIGSQSSFVSDKIEEELQMVQKSVMEVKSFVGDDCLNHNQLSF